MTCTKTRYRDRVAALLVLSKLQLKDSSRRSKIERRAYRCPHCHGWHLTSQHRRPRTA